MSIYRVIVPIVGGVFDLLAGGLFFFDQFFLPRRQAPGRLTRPDQGQTCTGPLSESQPQDQIWPHHLLLSTIQFGSAMSLAVFSSSIPRFFQLTNRCYTTGGREERLQTLGLHARLRSHVHGSTMAITAFWSVATLHQQSATQPDISKKEVRQSSEMNYDELEHTQSESRLRCGATEIAVREKFRRFAAKRITWIDGRAGHPVFLLAGRKAEKQRYGHHHCSWVSRPALHHGVAPVHLLGNVSQLPPVLAGLGRQIFSDWRGRS